MIQEKIHEVEHHFKATFKHIEEIAKRHNVSIAFLKDLEYIKTAFSRDLTILRARALLVCDNVTNALRTG